MRKRIETIGLLGALGALVAYSWWRIASWTHFLAASAYGHRSDFAEYYLTSSIGQRFGWHSLYSPAARDAVARTIPAPPVKNFPIDFPPAVGWLVRPFTGLSVDSAYWIWVPGLVVAYVMAWWLLTEGPFLRRLVLLVAPLGLFPVVFGFTLGQLVGFEVLGVAVAYVCLARKWDFAAGLALSPLLLHPQCLLLVPVILVPLERWRAVLGFVATAAVQAVLSAAFLGVSGVRAFLHEVNYVHAHRIEIWTTLSFPLAVHNRGASDVATISVVVAVVVAARRNRGDIRAAFAAAIIGSLLVAPFIHIQDEMSLVMAGWLLVAGRRHLATFWIPMAGFCLLALDVPSTRHSWGYAVMAMEVVWLLAVLVQQHAPVQRAGQHFAPPRAQKPNFSGAVLEPVGADF